MSSNPEKRHETETIIDEDDVYETPEETELLENEVELDERGAVHKERVNLASKGILLYKCILLVCA